MGGRNLTAIERLRLRAPDWPEVASRGFFAFVRALLLFFRWAYLRVTRKTAYRFAPMYETKASNPNPPLGTVSPIRQANGLYLPAPPSVPRDPTMKDDIRAVWDALEAKTK